MERIPLGRGYRMELDRLGLPQPETLKRIDPLDEVIRLRGIPAPLNNGLKELPEPDGTASGIPRQHGD
jgi:hypothetical protein